MHYIGLYFINLNIIKHNMETRSSKLGSRCRDVDWDETV